MNQNLICDYEYAKNETIEDVLKISRDFPFYFLFLSTIGPSHHGLPRSIHKLFTWEAASGHLAAQRSSYV